MQNNAKIDPDARSGTSYELILVSFPTYSENFIKIRECSFLLLLSADKQNAYQWMNNICWRGYQQIV